MPRQCDDTCPAAVLKPEWSKYQKTGWCRLHPSNKGPTPKYYITLDGKYKCDRSREYIKEEIHTAWRYIALCKKIFEEQSLEEKEDK